MFATRYPCAFAGTVLSLALLFGSAPFASAQPANPYPNNSAAIDQTMQQMVALFPSMTPQQFIHLQNALNQMIQTMPNDPYYNANSRLQKAPGTPNFGSPYQNRTAYSTPYQNTTNTPYTTPYQNATPVSTPVQQNSLFPGRPGIAQKTPAFTSNPANINQNQFANVGQNQSNKANCHKHQPGAAANTSQFAQQPAAAQQHHHHHNPFAPPHHHKK